MGSGDRCKLPQGGDGRQTLFGAFWAENASGKSFWYISTSALQQTDVKQYVRPDNRVFRLMHNTQTFYRK